MLTPVVLFWNISTCSFEAARDNYLPLWIVLIRSSVRKAPFQVRIQPTRLLRRAIAGRWMLIAQWATVTFMLQLSFPCLLGSVFHKVNYLHLKVRADSYGIIWHPSSHLTVGPRRQAILSVARRRSRGARNVRLHPSRAPPLQTLTPKGPTPGLGPPSHLLRLARSGCL